jgi:hypothetical protein
LYYTAVEDCTAVKSGNDFKHLLPLANSYAISYFFSFFLSGKQITIKRKRIKGICTVAGTLWHVMSVGCLCGTAQRQPGPARKKEETHWRP